MTAFYRCEIKGSISKPIFICYTEAYYNPNLNKFKAEADMEVENKIYQYFDEKLSRIYGDIESVNIIDISPQEYYGMKKSNTAIFI